MNTTPHAAAVRACIKCGSIGNISAAQMRKRSYICKPCVAAIANQQRLARSAHKMPNDLLGERWAVAPGTNGLYEVSDHGRVRSRANGKRHPKIIPVILKPCLNVKNGYLYVGIVYPFGRMKKSLHRLVASTFIGPVPLKMDVAHLDGDKRNCLLRNLAIVTRAENEAHKIIHGTRKPKTLPMNSNQPERTKPNDTNNG